MKKLLLGLFLLLPIAASLPAKAQSLVVQTCGTLPKAYAPGATRDDTVDINGNKCISGSISASFASFHLASVLTPLTATTSSQASSTFTAGQTVVVTNIGTTNFLYCQPGATATLSSQPIAPNGGWFAFATTSETTIACLTSTSTTTANFAVGTGGPAGTGGGGGSSGGGSTNITQTAGTNINATVAATGQLPIDVVPSNNLATLLSAPVPATASSNCSATGSKTGTQAAQSDQYGILCQDVWNWGGAVLGAATAYGTPPSGNVPGVNAAVTQLPGTTYNTVAASQTTQALTGGGGGATGDLLNFCMVIPTSTSPGVVTILDNATTIVAFPGGASSISNLVPFVLSVGSKSTSGAWKVTTGSNLSVVCNGKFT